jgi:hypothetical protein
MLIQTDFEVAEPVERVWRYFDDIPAVAACLPGAELTDNLGNDRFQGKVAVRMGPVKLRFAGTAHITERDEPSKRIVVQASGADEKGRGQAEMLVTAILQPSGRGMISDVTAVLMRDFSANLQDRIARADRGEDLSLHSASPAQGFTVARRAAMMALTRLFRRFFLPYRPNPT